MYIYKYIAYVREVEYPSEHEAYLYLQTHTHIYIYIYRYICIYIER